MDKGGKAMRRSRPLLVARKMACERIWRIFLASPADMPKRLSVAVFRKVSTREAESKTDAAGPMAASWRLLERPRNLDFEALSKDFFRKIHGKRRDLT